MDYMIATYVIISILLLLLIKMAFNSNGKKRDFEIDDAYLGLEELKAHAIGIARNHFVKNKSFRTSNWLILRMNKNFNIIQDAFKILNDDVQNGFPVPSAAEWLLDNFYVIEEEVKDIRQSLPDKHLNRLPVLKSGYLRGYPRIFAIALEIVSHSDGKIEETVIKGFIEAYQTQKTLLSKELWALALMLRIALIEKVAQICIKMLETRRQWLKAEEVTELLLAEKDKGKEEVLNIINEYVRERGAVYSSFIEHLLNKLKKQGKKGLAALKYIDERLYDQGLKSEEIASFEHQVQAASQVSIGNALTSLKFISSMDWNEIFESLSHVEMILKQDPTGIYGKMDFESRDYYRHAIGKLAELYNVSETLVVLKALECAKESEALNGEGLKNKEARYGNLNLNHIGYYIIGRGRTKLLSKIGNRYKLYKSFSELIRMQPEGFYIGSILFITSVITSLSVYYVIRKSVYIEIQPAIAALLAFISSIIPASEIAVALVNTFTNSILKPTLIPKLQLKEGIPEEYSTMVIVPTLLPNEKRVDELVEQLEIHYLSNREKNLYFALVGDFKDSDEESNPEDEKIIDRALKGIEKLNKQYSTDEKDIFYFFHRKRQYNNAQKRWMGWERKRGAIIELNELLRGSKNTSYNIMSCEFDKIPNVRFIITLDADTKLPIGAAKRLIGTLAHPLNKAIVDESKNIVVEGYGILQPRIVINTLSTIISPFTKIFSGQGGIDPYTNAISDVYQDLFGEGIFTGKGIYDLDIFQKVLKDAIPDNAILSHDLLEGCYIRAGLVSDISLVDGYPARYNSFSMRLHRWVRGDWQLLPWLSSKIRNREGEKVKNPLSLICKWKILDNLRRSLVSPGLFFLIVFGLLILPGSMYVWLGFAILSLSVYLLIQVVRDFLDGSYFKYKQGKYAAGINPLKAGIYQVILQIVFLPYQAYLMIDAIIRTIVRLYFTKRNMLEWVTAADMEASLKNDAKSFLRRMWMAPIAGLILFAAAAQIRPSALIPSVIIALMWVSSFYTAYIISKPYKPKAPKLKSDEIELLREIARKTWAFFEDFVTEKENFLPPDNYQEDPYKGIAHRTSPTNIGLMMASVISAADLGYISQYDMVEFLNNVVNTLDKLDKWEGHLYNWYNTTNLKVLRPAYVSTVDSGNFIGYLMVISEALKEFPKLDCKKMAQGLIDTMNAAQEEYNNVTNINDWKMQLKVYLDKYQDVQNQKEELRKILEQIISEIEVLKSERKLKKHPWIKKINYMCESFIIELDKSDFDDLRVSCGNLKKRIDTIINNTKFLPLYDTKRQLFYIGYDAEKNKFSKSYYDLLASEARQASYIAIARGEVDVKHWFKLGRRFTMIGDYRGLVSWTGTMFEYLMPLLIIKNYENTLMDETYRFVIAAQKRYSKMRNIPWGVTESAYFAFDMNLNYQYKAFGVPELGLKRGLVNDMVVAPYAVMLAFLVDPLSALENLKWLAKEGLCGKYGFYEAIDYTPSRLSQDQRGAVVKSFMAHHQGMILLSLNNVLNNNIMQSRFHANPIIKSAELLLQEKVPLRVVLTKGYNKDKYIPRKKPKIESNKVIRRYGIPEGYMPHMHILSNGKYSVMITNGGSGYSKYNNIAVTRWTGLINEINGSYIYIRNVNKNNVWSASYEPYNIKPDKYRVEFSPEKAEFRRRDGDIETRTEIIVSTEDNTEIRRVSLTNHDNEAAVIELTSYLEIVLSHPDADIAHPAFNKLFVTTEFNSQYNFILAKRRPRSDNDTRWYALHMVNVEGEVIGNIQYETDRAKFIGRNRTLRNPEAMDVDRPLSNTTGAVLDPVMSIRHRVKINPGKTVVLSYITSISDNEKEIFEIAEKYSQASAIERAFELAWTRSQIESGYLGFKSDEISLYLKMIPHILLPSLLRRNWEKQIAANVKGQSELWVFGISGDVPVILLIIDKKEDIEVVYTLLKGHEYWRMKGLEVDLVILVGEEASYIQPLQDLVKEAVSSGYARDLLGKRGGIFILNKTLLSEEDNNLLYATARIVLNSGLGPLDDQLELLYKTALENKLIIQDRVPYENKPDVQHEKINSKGLNNENTSSNELGKLDTISSLDTLSYFNGLGGFDTRANEYVIYLKKDSVTPVPWSNIIANESFGFIVTESGGGYTWSCNSRENKLTPWSNDPIKDTAGEVIYLRDDVTGDYNSLTPSPVRGKGDYIIRHGQGYTSFMSLVNDFEQELCQFVSVKDPVKISLIRLKNKNGNTRKISLFYYVRPVLGVNEKVTSQYIVTSIDMGTGIGIIKNNFNTEFPNKTAFIDSSETERSFTGDNLEFLGPDGSLEKPEAIFREKLSGTIGAGLVPCAAMQIRITINPGEEKNIVFLLGQSDSIEKIRDICFRYRDINNVKNELNLVKEMWESKLGVVQVNTPDSSMNIMVNRWLLYQVISCRLFSRSAFYQSGGAFGFRDQLQDVMALIYAWPDAIKRQILLHASRQFPEGDVQHWWHMEAGKGIRTRYSDDLLWLPYVTIDYITATEDWSILDIEVPYIEDEPLPEGHDERYSIPRISDKKGTIYEHCIKAIDRALRFGEHGIPLMGSGDWNDGMNKVGNKGKGESVWLGWFLSSILNGFIPICKKYGDEERAELYKKNLENIVQSIEKHAWDGSWYRRAYFDDGKPLGSNQNSECKIDSLAQSWAGITGFGDINRTKEALKAVQYYLIDKEEGIIKLLTPAFNDGDLEPGYIKGYVPGVRENGGQYTHAAVWVILAFAKMGEGDKAHQLYNMITPINHSCSQIEAARYKTEPYVMAADVYAIPPNTGRGGWTWYTGAAGWMYRVGVEHILGIKRRGDKLVVDPCIPSDWSEYSVVYKYGNTKYNITVKNPNRVNKGIGRVTVDNIDVKDKVIHLVDDGKDHFVIVEMQ
ncbi:MAG TPA: glycosyl transferase [Clostridiaceae bacterium]|nr:glycosyl transferase [Clostridiaceae bacterium]